MTHIEFRTEQLDDSELRFFGPVIEVREG